MRRDSGNDDQEDGDMRPIRYVGRHRNAGYGYSLVQRLRRELAYWLRDHGLVVLGWLIDFDRHRYDDDYA